MISTHIRHTAGFTLIEVLVAMVILAIGLLGLAGLQTLSLKDNQDSYLYSQATALAYDMSDRIRANASAWQGAVPAAAADCPVTSCNSVANKCTPAQMAAFDYCYWTKSVSSKLASGATAVVSISTNTGVCNGGNAARCLTISWAGSGKNQSSAKFQLEVKP